MRRVAVCLRPYREDKGDMEYLAVLLPSAGVGAVFYFAMRALFNADRSERAALARAEEEVQKDHGDETCIHSDEDYESVRRTTS